MLKSKKTATALSAVAPLPYPKLMIHTSGHFEIVVLMTGDDGPYNGEGMVIYTNASKVGKAVGDTLKSWSLNNFVDCPVGDEYTLSNGEQS